MTPQLATLIANHDWEARARKLRAELAQAKKPKDIAFLSECLKIAENVAARVADKQPKAK